MNNHLANPIVVSEYNVLLPVAAIDLDVSIYKNLVRANHPIDKGPDKGSLRVEHEYEHRMHTS